MDEKLKCPHKRIDHNGECLDCDEPVWADQTMTPIDKAIAALEAIGRSNLNVPIDTQAAQAWAFEVDALKMLANQALTELKAARQSGVPDGWVLVPREPTREMCHAADMTGDVWDVWKDMVAAANAANGESNG